MIDTNTLQVISENVRTAWPEKLEYYDSAGSEVYGLAYGEDDFGDYVTVGCNLPDGVYAEIEDGTYGELQGFRIYI